MSVENEATLHQAERATTVSPSNRTSHLNSDNLALLEGLGSMTRRANELVSDHSSAIMNLFLNDRGLDRLNYINCGGAPETNALGSSPVDHTDHHMLRI